MVNLTQIADRLIVAHDGATTLPPITAGEPDFDVAAGYDVLHEIERAARARAGAGRPQDRLHQPHDLAALWRVPADVGARLDAYRASHADGVASLSLRAFVQPRIEPEVVFGLNAPVPRQRCARGARLRRVDRAGFEIVQCHFPDWKFAAADSTAAFGLHGALVVGAPVP